MPNDQKLGTVTVYFRNNRESRADKEHQIMAYVKYNDVLSLEGDAHVITLKRQDHRLSIIPLDVIGHVDYQKGDSDAE